MQFSLMENAKIVNILSPVDHASTALAAVWVDMSKAQKATFLMQMGVLHASIGTPAVTTRGMQEAEMEEIAQYIDEALAARTDGPKLAALRAQVKRLCGRFPIYPELLRSMRGDLS